MRRVKMKETIIGNNPQEKSDGNDLFSLLPLDLKVEILEKLPAKSIAKFIFVSKFWSSVINGKDFTNLYLARSSSRPRLLCIASHRGRIFFHTCSQEDPDHHNITQNSDYLVHFCPPVRGLICSSQNSSQVVISNPSTGQSVTLPRVKTERSIICYLGYDPVNDVYKVLCMTLIKIPPEECESWIIVSDEHQVFTLGAQNAAWRMIKCKHPHAPAFGTKVLCWNGFLYYFAWIIIEASLISFSLISFDLRSEDFNVIKLPEDLSLEEYCDLVYYRGKLALTGGRFRGTLDLRVLEDANKQEWSKVCVLIPSWPDLGERFTFYFKGALSTGEFIFARLSSFEPLYIFYDLKQNNARKVRIEGIGNDFVSMEAFLDHVESVMILPVIR